MIQVKRGGAGFRRPYHGGFDGPINSESSGAYVGQQLVAALRSGDIVVDNIGSHKSPAIRRMIRGAAVRLLVPAVVFVRSQPGRASLRQIKHWIRIAAAHNRRRQRLD